MEEQLENDALQEADENHRKRQRVEEASSSSGHQTPSSTVGKVLLNTKQQVVITTEPYVFSNDVKMDFKSGDVIASSKNRCEVVVEFATTANTETIFNNLENKMVFKAWWCHASVMQLLPWYSKTATES